jgi:hypothetical protein
VSAAKVTALSGRAPSGEANDADFRPGDTGGKEPGGWLERRPLADERELAAFVTLAVADLDGIFVTNHSVFLTTTFHPVTQNKRPPAT